MADGDVSVIVNCYQMGSSNNRAIFGSRAVVANANSIAGMTHDNVYFGACAHCRAVRMYLGVQGSHLQEVLLAPDDPRAILLCQITDLPSNESWGKRMDKPARVVGMINVHGAKIMSPGCCFQCGI